MKYTLKLADYLDVPRLLVAAEKAFRVTPFNSILDYSQQRAEKMINMLLELGKERSIILFAFDDSGVVVGVIAAMVFFTPAGQQEIVSETLWWVDEGYRKTRLSITLINALEFWAVKIGVNYVALSNMENEHAAGVEKFYERKGYKKVETTFFKDLVKE